MKNNAAMEAHWSNNPRFKAEQEPVAKVCHDLDGHIGWNPKLTQLPDEGTPLYTTPPQRKEPKQKPVAFELYHHICLKLAEAGCKLSEQQKMVLCNLKAVTTPPQRTWIGLTDEERVTLFEKYGHRTGVLVGAVEDKLKEKNT